MHRGVSTVNLARAAALPIVRGPHEDVLSMHPRPCPTGRATDGGARVLQKRKEGSHLDARSILFGRFSKTCSQCGGSGVGGRSSGGGEYACPRCRGIGSIGNCPDCDGTGLRGRNHGIGGSGEGLYACTRCRGVGAIGNCPDCGGTGMSGRSGALSGSGGGEHVCPRCRGKGFF